MGTLSARPTSPAVRVSVVAPCFNEGLSVLELHRRVSAVCSTVLGDSYEVVLVNDGSTDDTWGRLLSLAERDPAVVAVNLSRNHGHQLALSAGLTVARGDRILIIDADLQDPPELLPEMMALMDRGADVVYGRRRERHGESQFKRLTAKGFYRLLERMTDVPIPRDTGDFRLMSRRALDVLLSMPEHYRFIRGMVSWIGMSQVPLEYDRDARFAGETKYPFARMLKFAIDAITGFSVKPLRVASYTGAVTAAAGLVTLAYTLWAWLAHDTIRGWTSLMAVVLLLGSLQLVVIGVIGEYLGRLYMEAKRRPLFVIQEVVGGHAISPEPRAPISRTTQFSAH